MSQFGLDQFVETSKNLVKNPDKIFPTGYANIINFLVIAAAIVAVVLVLNAGTEIMTSFGNEEKVARAKQTLAYTAIGLAVVVFAILLISLVATLVRTGRL